MNSKENELLEATLVERRINELRQRPIRGNFDIAHLKKIHHYIFQDLPQAGLWNYGASPGEFRPPVAQGLDWIKNRPLESIESISCVAYSRMDGAAQKQLVKILAAANPAKLGKLKTREFTEIIGNLYVVLDYIHPFSEGNSRTLREFTRQLAEESGYYIDWARFNQQPAGRDILYIARDLSVNPIALPHIQNFATERDVRHTMIVFERNRNLPNLLQDAIRPTRAIAFEKDPEHEALKKHPELSCAYTALHNAETYFQNEMPSEPDSQRQALSQVKVDIQTNLNAGEIRKFRESWKAHRLE